jgi:hypothetical protein
VALALIVVAALVPGARADDGGMPPSGTFGDETSVETSVETMEAEGSAGTLEAKAPAAPEGAAHAAGDARIPAIALAEGGGGTVAGGAPADGNDPQDPVPPAVADQRGDQQHAAAAGGSGNPGEQPSAGQDQSDHARRDEQGGDPGVCAGDGCSPVPPDPGNAIVAAAGDGPFARARQVVAQLLQKVAGRRQQPAPQEDVPAAQEAAPPAGTLLDWVEEDLAAVEGRQDLLDAQGGLRTVEQQVEDEARVERAADRIRRLGPVSPAEFVRWEGLQDRIGKMRHALDMAHDRGSNQLSAVEHNLRELAYRQERRADDGSWRTVQDQEDDQAVLARVLSVVEQQRSGVAEETPEGIREGIRLAALERWARAAQEELAREREAGSAWRGTRTDLIKRDIAAVEHRLERVAGRPLTPSDLEQYEGRLAWAFVGIRQLERLGEEAASAEELAALTDRAEAARRRLRMRGEHPMISVELPPPLAPGQPPPEGQQAATGTPGFGGDEGPVPDPAGFGSKEAKVPATPGVTATEVDRTIPPYPAVPARGMSPGRLAAVQAWAAGLSGAGLLVLVQALMAWACKGGMCPAAMPGAVVPGFPGVPGALQG